MYFSISNFTKSVFCRCFAPDSAEELVNAPQTASWLGRGHPSLPLSGPLPLRRRGFQWGPGVVECVGPTRWLIRPWVRLVGCDLYATDHRVHPGAEGSRFSAEEETWRRRRIIVVRIVIIWILLSQFNLLVIFTLKNVRRRVLKTLETADAARSTRLNPGRVSALIRYDTIR